MSAQQAAVAAPFLELQDIGKTYPGVVALSGVSLSVAPSAGAIRIDGAERSSLTVKDATKAGIAFVHQELNLFDNLDVAANVFIGREPLRGGPLKLVGSRKLHADVVPLLAR